ncbi:hypothetical protein V1525DRAFT_160747 [Lipomyces kononenkoae]|uniref:Uncharacterized protein n=1 Tax=Lipomyces kononenkoae TaxID=34357 RepID=A0ACC3SPX3_LIPKO
MTTEVGSSLCSRLWRVTKTLKEASCELENLNINKDEILAQIESQKAYVAARTKQRLPSNFEDVRNVANNIERLMIERNYELEQVHTRLRGHKNAQAVFNKIRRRRPAIEKEIRKYNNMVEALPLRPEVKPPKISYEILVNEMNGREETSSLLHHFFRLDNFGITLSDVPSWVNNPGMRRAIQLYLLVRALREEMTIMRAEIMRTIRWAMENLRALVAYVASTRRCEVLLVEKMWTGVSIAQSLLDNLKSMYNADFSMEEAKALSPNLEELIQRAYSCLSNQLQIESGDREVLVEDGADILDEDDDDSLASNDAILEIAMLTLNDSHEPN